MTNLDFPSRIEPQNFHSIVKFKTQMRWLCYYHTFLILYHNYLYTKLFKSLFCLEIKTV